MTAGGGWWVGGEEKPTKTFPYFTGADTLSGTDVVRGPFADIPAKGLCTRCY